MSTTRRGAPGGRPGMAAGELVLLVAAAALAGASFVVWVAAGLDALCHGRVWTSLSLRAAPALLVAILRHPSAPAASLPPALRHGVGAPFGLYAALAAEVGLLVGPLLLVVRRGRRRGPRRRSGGAVWASRNELTALSYRRGEARVVLGSANGSLVAAERCQSVLLVGPTQCGKSSGLAIPALLEWPGPVLATSVKGDLVRTTAGFRSGLGPVAVYDPAGVSGAERAGWSPLAASTTWPGARRMAASLCSVARSGGGGLDDAAFSWYATAEKLLAPLLFAAACAGLSMTDLVRWLDTEEVLEVLAALERAAVPEALQAARASFSREERQRSSVYTTAETVLAAFADPTVAASAARSDIDPAFLFGAGAGTGGPRARPPGNPATEGPGTEAPGTERPGTERPGTTGAASEGPGSGRPGTLFVVAPAHEQARLEPVFVALLREVLDAAITRAGATGRPLDPPLLVVLDEAANIAPLPDLDRLAATASGHGVQLLTIWQDVAQIETRYGGRAATVVNNHRAKVLCSGITDPRTLEHVSALIGEEEAWNVSTTTDGDGRASRTSAPGVRRLVVDWIRRLPPGEAVLVYGHLAPARLRLRPWYQDRELTRRARRGSDARTR